VIDGKPAGQVLSGMRENATRGTTPAQTYGADVAKRNIAERGPQAAIEDYFNRNRLDAQRAPMPTEPGSMAERRATAEKNQTRPNAIGPAQRAMLDARQSREDRAKRDSEDQRNYDTLRARDITENVGYRLGRNAATTDDVINKNLSFADRRDQLQSERGYKDNDVTDNLVSEALRSNPANPPEFFKDFTGESERYSKETGARGLAGARADAAGSRVLRTPAVSADMDFRTALRDQPTQRAMRGEVTPVTPLGREKPPALARPRPQAPAAEAPAPALVQRTNALADRLRARANTPYQQRMTEGAVTIEDMVRSAGGVARTLAGLPEKARQFSNRTNQWAENFRNSR
jgi:hypothetical protein